MNKYALLILLFLTKGAFAAHYELFTIQHNISVPHYHYNDVIRKLKSGDTIEFSDHKIFEIGSRLDVLMSKVEMGFRTCIFEIKGMPDRVIRIPIDEQINYRFGITQTRLGFKELEYLGPNVVKYFGGVDNEYALVEKLPAKRYTFLEFIRNESIAKPLQKKMLRSLLDFAKKTAIFTEIGDFNITQFTYDIENNRWVLFDWVNQHIKLYNENKTIQLGNIWEHSITAYLTGNNWDDPAIDEFIPTLTPKEKEKLEKIGNLLMAITEKEQDKIIAKSHSSAEKSCSKLIKSFF